MESKRDLILGVVFVLVGALVLIFHGSFGQDSYSMEESKEISQEYLLGLEPYQILSGDNLSLVGNASLKEGYLFEYEFYVNSQENVGVREKAFVEMVVSEGKVVKTNFSNNLIINNVYCEDSQRDVEICTMEYAPVCGNNGETYSNPCMACKDSSVEFYVSGKCP